MATTFYVRYREDTTDWAVERQGGARASAVKPTKAEAIAAARSLANRERPSEVIIFRTDGSIENRHNYN